MGNLRGVEQFKRELETLDKKLQKQVIRQAMRAGAKVLAAEIKANAPVETGALKRSVKVKAGPRRKHKIIFVVEVSGGHDGPFVGFVELGTRTHPANPFIRRSVDGKRDEVLDKILDAIAATLSGLS